MVTSKPDCRWCKPDGTSGDEPIAKNRSHFVVAKPNPPNPSAMIIPFRHVEAPFDFSAEEWADFGEMLDEAKRYLAEFQPDGFTVGWNVGAAAGQHIFHAHLHIICRYQTDPSGGRGLRDFVLR